MVGQVVGYCLARDYGEKVCKTIYEGTHYRVAAYGGALGRPFVDFMVHPTTEGAPINLAVWDKGGCLDNDVIPFIVRGHLRPAKRENSIQDAARIAIQRAQEASSDWSATITAIDEVGREVEALRELDAIVSAL